MSYAGDLSPQEAWAKLEDGAILVDVRTEGEWAHIGIPDTTSAGGTRNDPLFIQWNLAGGLPNARFIEQLKLQLKRAGPRRAGHRTGLPVPVRRPVHRRRDRRDARPATPPTTSWRASKANRTATATALSTAGRTAACPPTPESTK